MHPNYKYLQKKLDMSFPLIGFYDTPKPENFDDLTDASSCMFSFYERWGKGKHLRITKDKFGCPGAGKWLTGSQTRSFDDYVIFLCDEEGLKANHDLMKKWLEHEKHYEQIYDNIIIGPLKESEYGYLQSITFYVNPDQLSILSIGAQLLTTPDDPPPVTAPFGSGCMQLVTLFRDLNKAEAIIGATDMAMRKYLPPDILAFTVTKPMFEQLCNLGKDSYLEKRFLKSLKKARKKM